MTRPSDAPGASEATALSDGKRDVWVEGCGVSGHLWSHRHRTPTVVCEGFMHRALLWATCERCGACTRRYGWAFGPNSGAVVYIAGAEASVVPHTQRAWEAALALVNSGKPFEYRPIEMRRMR